MAAKTKKFKETKIMDKPAAKQNGSLALLKRSSFSRPQLAVFVLVFAVIGFLIYKSFAAAPLVASLQGEQMSPPAGGSLVYDSTASGGKALKLATNGTATGSVYFPATVSTLSVMARGALCYGGPQMNVSLDGVNVMNNTLVGSTSWGTYSTTLASAARAGSHWLAVTFTNDFSHGYYNKCSRDLFIDVTNFYGVTAVTTPAPTVSLSAMPSSLNSGASSTLTWNSTNATSCTASGAWSGSRSVYGSASTGALNQTSSYGLSCSGAGGTAIAIASINVTITSPPPTGGLTPPTPPQAYAVPAGALSVSTGAQLAAALAGSTARDIVLEDGNYDYGSFIQFGVGHRLWARNVGRAILDFGLVPGGNYGGGGQELHGLAFNVNDPARTFQNSIVNMWGPAATSVKILDSSFQGNYKIGTGLLAYSLSGLTLQRSQFYRFTDNGVRLSDNTAVAYGAATPKINQVADLVIDGVTASPPGATNGTAEAGLWVGQPVINGVSRIKIRNVSWSGLETVNNSWDTTFSDLDINMSGVNQSAGVAIYMEHYNYRNVFTNFNLVGAKTGINAEWDYGTTGNAGARNTTIKNGTIDAAGALAGSKTVGVFLDQGTDSTTITGVTFKNQNWAGIGAYLNVGSNSFGGNTYQLPPGAVQITYNRS